MGSHGLSRVCGDHPPTSLKSDQLTTTKRTIDPMPEALATDAGHAPAASEHASAAPATETVDVTATTAAPAAQKKDFRTLLQETAAELSAPQDDAASRDNQATTPAAENTGDQPKPQALQPHSRWTADEKTAFATLPPEGQKAMLTQYANWEKGFNKKFEEVAAVRKLKDEIDPLFTPDVRQRMQSAGLTEGQVIKKLAEFAQQIDTDPVNAIAHLMQRHQIDPRIFLQEQAAAAQAANGQMRSDTVQQIVPLIQPLLAKIAELEHGQNAWHQHQIAEQEKAIEATIVSVIEDKDASGAPKFPYLDRVADHMANLIEHDPRYATMDPRQRLEESYLVSIYSDPAIRDEIATAEASKRALAMEQTRANSRLKDAATAKPAASMSAPGPAKKVSIRDAYIEAKRELGM